MYAQRHHHPLQSAHTTGWHITTFEQALILAGIAAGGILLGAVLGAVLSQRLTTRQAQRALLEARVTRQLDEFYAPLTMLLGQSKLMKDQLKKILSVSGEFNILRNVQTVTHNSAAHRMALEIVAVGEHMKRILDEHSGLAASVPESFATYRTHLTMLAAAMRGHAYEEVQDAMTFPDSFSSDITRGYNDCRKTLAGLTRGAQ
jgi:hypothetical protein